MKQWKTNVNVEQKSESSEEDEDEEVESEESREEADMELGCPETKTLKIPNVTQAACKNLSEKQMELLKSNMVSF